MGSPNWGVEKMFEKTGMHQVSKSLAISLLVVVSLSIMAVLSLVVVTEAAPAPAAHPDLAPAPSELSGAAPPHQGHQVLCITHLPQL